MPRVTVAILAYNRPEFLGEAIESVLAQTYTDFKLVIYDNCSEKDLKSVVDQYDDPRIVYHRNEKNLGMFGNAAQAVDLCDTELLDIFHDDDRMFPWALERLVEAMDRYPEIGVAASRTVYVLGTKEDISVYKDDTTGRYYKGFEIAENLWSKSDNYFQHFTGVMLRVSILRERGVNYRTHVGLYADCFFNIEYSAAGIPGYAYDAPLIEYRIHPGAESQVIIGNTKFHENHKICVDNIQLLNISDNAKYNYRRMYAKTSIFSFVSPSISKNIFDADQFNEWRRLVCNDLGYQMSDEEYNETISIAALGSLIIDVGHREASIADYHARIADLKKIGISVPLARRLKWFLKYIVWQRWLGRRPQ